MKDKNFSKEFDDVFDEELKEYQEFNFYGYSLDKIGIAQGIPFRMQKKLFIEKNDLISYLHTITAKQKVIFGGVYQREVYEPILQEEVNKFSLNFALLFDGG
jgi:hypothetical protein